MASTTPQRKIDHLRLCCEAEVEFQRKTTLLEEVELVATALPNLDPEEVDLSVDFLGRRLRAPILIGALTGGAPGCERINRDLARVAAECGIGLALGSQRAMLESPDLTYTYKVRDLAPDILLLGNIGLSQALQITPALARTLMERVGADGLCLHLNAAMELCQKDGERRFHGALEAIGRLAAELGERLIVKETGCGMSREDGLCLRQVGVVIVDVAGAGGTSWTRVERLRAGGPATPGGNVFDEWGIPTAASLLELRGIGLRLIASGGLRSGLDFAKGIALGAELSSAALPFLRAHSRGGVEEVRRYTNALISGLRMAAVLTGSRNLAALRAVPKVITGRLREWLEQRNLGVRSARLVPRRPRPSTRSK